MAGKTIQIATLTLTIDLECKDCSKKIRKAISKITGLKKIQTVAFDEKKNTVTITGPFDSYELRKKLMCKLGKIIQEVQIKEEKKPVGSNDNKQGEGGNPNQGQNQNKGKEKDKEKAQPGQCQCSFIGEEDQSPCSLM